MVQLRIEPPNGGPIVAHFRIERAALVAIRPNLGRYRLFTRSTVFGTPGGQSVNMSG